MRSVIASIKLAAILLVGITTECYAQSFGSINRSTSEVKQFEMTEFDINLSAAFTNPFDRKDIALDMILVSPSGKALTLPCYFVSGSSASSNWKARFAAREQGVYSYHFKISRNGSSVATSSEQNLKAKPTAKKGFLHKKNLWSFQYDNGEIFRGIGENYGWEPRDFEESTFRAPYKYDYLLPKLAKNKANFFRTWMCPWNLPLQWKKVTQTNLYENTDDYFHGEAIRKMDELVKMCDSLELHMMLTLDYHGALSNHWSLNSFNSANGGPIQTPNEFFTNAAARDMYKNRLRYLVARWGYSPAIGAWEFFNEVDNAVFNESNGGLGNYSHADVTSWHKEMATFLKSIDPYEHLVTTSVSHRDISGMNNLSELDFNQRHVYGDPYVGQIDQTIKTFINSTGKPYVIGEFGYRWEDDNYESYADKWKFDFKQGMWLGLFTPTLIVPMTWWWEMFDAKAQMTGYFKSISEIDNRMKIAAGRESDYQQWEATSNTTGQKVLAVRAGKKYFVYVLNSTTSQITTSVSINNVEAGTFNIISFDPKNGDDYTYTKNKNAVSSGGKLQVNDIIIEGMRERILIIENQFDSTGHQYSTGMLTIPGKIEAEDFDLGGEGVAYHDYDLVNDKGNFRSNEGVDVEHDLSGGYSVSSIIEREWLEYTVTVASSGSYTIDANVASTLAGKSFHLEFDGIDITGQIETPATGGENSFENVSVISGFIAQGNHIMRVVMDSSGFKLNNLEFTFFNQAPSIAITSPSDGQSIEIPTTVEVTFGVADEDGSVTMVSLFADGNLVGESIREPFTISWQPKDIGNHELIAKVTDDKGLTISSEPVIVRTFKSQIPFTDGNSIIIPGLLEAEYFDIGGEGTAYHDLSVGNKFNQFRSEDVDIEVCADTGGGFSLGDLQTSEWVEYSINVAESQTYDAEFRVASSQSSGKFHLELNGNDVTGPITAPNTGGWQVWTTVTKKAIHLPAGNHVMRLVIDGEYFNLNFIKISKSNPVTDVADSRELPSLKVYPNPFAGYLIIENPSPASNQLLELFDPSGKLVFRSIAGSKTYIQTTQLISGLYQLRVHNLSTSQLGSIKLIKF